MRIPSRRRTRPFFRHLAATLAVLLIAAACSDDSKTPSLPPTPTAPTTEVDPDFIDSMSAADIEAAVAKVEAGIADAVCSLGESDAAGAEALGNEAQRALPFIDDADDELQQMSAVLAANLVDLTVVGDGGTDAIYRRCFGDASAQLGGPDTGNAEDAIAEILPVVCAFERYNGLYLKADDVDDPVSYEQSLVSFVALVADDSSLIERFAAEPAILAEQTRCAELPNLTFGSGSHPIIRQIEATTYRTVTDPLEECSIVFTDADGEKRTEVFPANTPIEFDVDATDSQLRNDGCGVLVAGEPLSERP